MNLDLNKQTFPKGIQIIVFDGVCNLCNSAIQFVIKRDKKRQFRYTSLEGDLGKQLLAERSIDVTKIDSIILINPDVAYYYKSSAALEISKGLKGAYPLMSIFFIIPLPIRDWVYDFIAKNRYKWFGKKQTCMIPTKEQQELFL